MKCARCGYKLCGRAEEKKGVCVPCERKGPFVQPRVEHTFIRTEKNGVSGDASSGRQTTANVSTDSSSLNVGRVPKDHQGSTSKETKKEAPL